jgi:hypothetical protein
LITSNGFQPKTDARIAGHAQRALTEGAESRFQRRKWGDSVPDPGAYVFSSLGGRSAILPMHGKKELGKGLENAMKKQLGLK